MSGDVYPAMTEEAGRLFATDVLEQVAGSFRLDPHQTALVLIDMQYASACRDTGLGRWLSERHRAHDGAYRFDRIERDVVPNLSRLLAFFRHEGLDVIHVRIGGATRNCRDLAPSFRYVEQLLGNYIGRREFAILDELAPQEGEPVLTKLSASAFNSSNLDAVLRNLGASQLIVGGVSTSHCVDLTGRDGVDRGYEVVIVEDGCAEDTPELHEMSLQLFRKLYGRVDTTTALLEELSTALNRTITVD